MTMPSTDILTRYQAYRTRRFLANDARTRHWFPSWRTRTRRRILAVAVVVTLIALLIISILSLFWLWTALLWLPATAIFILCWTMLQTVSGRQSDAPMGALDEWEIQQRNEARSIGLTITQGLVMTGVFALIFLSTSNIDNGRLAYSGACWILVGLLAGICSPSILLAWITPDPDPEDI